MTGVEGSRRSSEIIKQKASSVSGFTASSRFEIRSSRVKSLSGHRNRR